MERWLWLALSLAATGCAAARLECSAHGGPTWRLVRTAHFDIETNQALGELERDASFLERLHFVNRWLFSLEQDDDDPVEVIALGDEAQLQAAGIDAAGLAMLHAGPRRLFITSPSQPSRRGRRGAARGEAAPVQAHELAHVLSARVLPGLPLWLNEGLAEYAGATVFPDDATAVVGLMPARFSDELAGVAPISDLWDWRYAEMSDARRSWFYFSAWAWVHFLYNHHEEAFRRFLASLAGPADVRRRFEAQFPLRWQQAAREELDGYVRHGAYFSTTLRVPKPAGAREVRELDPAEVHLVRSRLALGATYASPAERLAASRREVERAVELLLGAGRCTDAVQCEASLSSRLGVR